MIKLAHVYASEPEECPFCGKYEVVVRENDEDGMFWCACKACDARGPVMQYSNTAVDAWNSSTGTNETFQDAHYKDTANMIEPTDAKILDMVESLNLRSAALDLAGYIYGAGDLFLLRAQVAKLVVLGLRSPRGAQLLRELMTKAHLYWEMRIGDSQTVEFLWMSEGSDEKLSACASTEGEAVLLAFYHAFELGHIKHG